MSDALCGPSNPLQQFKQQTQFDRTLQQDRLTSRQSPSQGFRSANPNAGLLDPEFEAFQAGVPPSELPHLQSSQQPPQNYGGPVQAPSWASDFQQMHISSPPPFQQQRMLPSGPSTANWSQGFRDHVAHTTPRAQTSASSPQQFQQMARFGGGLNGFQSSFAQSNMTPSMQSKGKEPVTEQFDEAAFERAFDQASSDMLGDAEYAGFSYDTVEDKQERPASVDYNAELLELQRANKERLRRAREQSEALNMANPLKDAQETATVQSTQEQSGVASEQDGDNSIDPAERLEVMQDPHQIHQETMEEHAEAQERAQEDDDALAATAQELLEKVQHNQTDKFRNSQFLGLMRKLRDREVKVEGDNMVETNSATTTASSAETQTQPLNSPSATPLFDNSEQRPAPLTRPAAPVDTRPYEYGIPHEEQDHDAGRGINAQDGQEVVDMLDRPGPMTDVTDDIASYDPELAERYGDSTNGTSSPYLMTRFPPGMRTVV